jgi:transcriptional regulator with XRE-family HTH domain
MIRFDTMALYRALDEQRRVRGLTWDQLAAEVGVSSATVRRTQFGGRMEVDGMLAMVYWLAVPVETFVRDGGTP